MNARVRVEEAALGSQRWGVFIERPGSIIGRTLWERYATQAEALAGAEAATAYLVDRGELPPETPQFHLKST